MPDDQSWLGLVVAWAWPPAGAATCRPAVRDRGRAGAASPRRTSAIPIRIPGRGASARGPCRCTASTCRGSRARSTGAAARAAGVDFAFIKATEGGDSVDPMFEDNWRATRRGRAFRAAAYHFYYFCRPAADQARMVHPERAAGCGAPCPRCWTWSGTTCRRPAPCGPTPRRCAAKRRSFFASLTEHYGQRPIIYTTLDFWERNEMWRLQRLSSSGCARSRPIRRSTMPATAGRSGNTPAPAWSRHSGAKWT